jgi:predicted nucleotidyltransferase
MRDNCPQMRDNIAKALLPEVRGRVLALLFGRPDQEFYLREIVRQTGRGRGAVARELRSLTEAGIVARQKRGHLTYFRANPESPVFPELRGLMLKTIGLADVVRESLRAVPGVRLAFIYGSMASGTADVRSDVDVFVVAEASFAEVSGALLPAQERLGREVVPTLYTPEEFAEALAAKRHFLLRVLQEPKIMLIGALDEPD